MNTIKQLGLNITYNTWNKDNVLYVIFNPNCLIVFISTTILTLITYILTLAMLISNKCC